MGKEKNYEQIVDSQGEKSTMIYKFDVQFSFMIITHEKI